MRLFAALLLLICCADAARAADPCAKYTDADAYNYCLAGSGPVARHRPSSKAPSRAFAPENARRVPRPASEKMTGRSLPPGMVRKPAPRGRVRFEIIVR
ncbi:hypothetical protein CCR94_23545 [Rhodoblastus sphagnicola]|uniref:Uncharacterized protein n=1 Tax=Rhodoblastus sphagnicola TaxID=333368 RepID=A0A2S6MUG2_9HYPH|nr:hypothetical protein [Rhodoblastus sphagnicola]MBB4196988.1 hypothetical protein [Rhodoblastus sphagnicola]PPQ26003.1 hypothetical protein CCR94_23545 [Rhodoblastus sphagnicola]